MANAWPRMLHAACTNLIRPLQIAVQEVHDRSQVWLPGMLTSAIGIEMGPHEDTGRTFSEILPVGTLYPVSCERSYCVVKENGDTFTITFGQGNSDTAKNNFLIESITIDTPDLLRKMDLGQNLGLAFKLQVRNLRKRLRPHRCAPQALCKPGLNAYRSR